MASIIELFKLYTFHHIIVLPHEFGIEFYLSLYDYGLNFHYLLISVNCTVNILRVIKQALCGSENTSLFSLPKTYLPTSFTKPSRSPTKLSILLIVRNILVKLSRGRACVNRENRTPEKKTVINNTRRMMPQDDRTLNGFELYEKVSQSLLEDKSMLFQTRNQIKVFQYKNIIAVPL